MNLCVISLAVASVLGVADSSYAQYGYVLGLYTPGHTRGSYGVTGCWPICECPGPFGNVAPSFPPALGPSTLTPPGLIPTPVYVASPDASLLPATEKQPSPPAAVTSAPTTPPLSTSSGRGPSRVMTSQTVLN